MPVETGQPAATPLRIGIDFDNTVVSYDIAFYSAAVERQLVPETLPQTKGAVRDYLRAVGRESDWTALQGYIYGARMDLAELYPGVIIFLERARERGIEVSIVSHKTLHPFIGPKYDMHDSARSFIERHGISRLGLAAGRVYFELTKIAKFKRIAAIGCSHFIDDLPEFLTDPDFPPGVTKLLFDPNNHHGDNIQFVRFRDWSALTENLMP